jgi:hypothetical protein
VYVYFPVSFIYLLVICLSEFVTGIWPSAIVGVNVFASDTEAWSLYIRQLGSEQAWDPQGWTLIWVRFAALDLGDKDVL